MKYSEAGMPSEKKKLTSDQDQTEWLAYLEAIPRLIQDLWCHIGGGATHSVEWLCHLHSQTKVT